MAEFSLGIIDVTAAKRPGWNPWPKHILSPDVTSFPASMAMWHHAGNAIVLPKRAAWIAVLSNCPRLEGINSFLKGDNCSILKLSGSRRKMQARGPDASELGTGNGCAERSNCGAVLLDAEGPGQNSCTRAMDPEHLGSAHDASAALRPAPEFPLGTAAMQ